MLLGARAYQRVVDGAASDPAGVQLGEQRGCRPGAEEPGVREVRRQKARDRAGSPARRRRQPRQDREGLERRMSRQAEPAIAERPERRLVVLVIGDRQGHRDACVDQQLRAASAGRHREATGRDRRRSAPP